MRQLEGEWALDKFTGVPETFIQDHCLPATGFIREWMNYMFPITQSNLGYHAIIGLAAISATVPPHVCTQDGDRLHGNFYGMVIGPSGGAKKTFAVRQMHQILQEVDQLRLLSFTLASSHGIVEEIMESPQRIIVIEEGSTFFEHVAPESGYGKGNRAVLNELYDGSPQKLMTISSKNRMKGKPGAATQFNPRLSVLVACTPTDIEANVLRSQFTGGFMGRFCFCLGLPARTMTKAILNDAARERLKILYSNLARVVPALTHGPCSGFTPEADAYFTTWQGQRPTVTSELEEPLIQRADVQARKIALLLAYDRHVYPFITAPDVDAHKQDIEKPWAIELDDIRIGCNLATVSVASARTMASLVSDSEEGKIYRRVVGYLKKYGPQSEEELGRFLGCSKKNLDSIITTLLFTHRVIRNRHNHYEFVEHPSDLDGRADARGNIIVSIAPSDGPYIAGYAQNGMPVSPLAGMLPAPAPVMEMPAMLRDRAEAEPEAPTVPNPMEAALRAQGSGMGGA